MSALTRAKATGEQDAYTMHSCPPGEQTWREARGQHEIMTRAIWPGSIHDHENEIVANPCQIATS